MTARPTAAWGALRAAGAAVAILLTPPVDAASAEDGALRLAPGTSATLAFEDDVEAAFVADPETADVAVVDTRRLIVHGRGAGITSLKVFDTAGGELARYAVHVDAQPGHAAAVLAHVAGPEPDIQVDAVGGALFVTGTARTPALAERLLRGIRAVSGDTPVVDALTLATPPQVNLDVVISEVSRSVTRELGIDWGVDINPFAHPLRTWASGTGIRLGTGALLLGEVYEQVIRFAGPATPNAPSETAAASNEVAEIGVVEPLRSADGGIVLAQRREVNSGKYRATAFLEALADNGLVVIHARPTLTTVSGQPAEFFSGLEIPVPTISDRVVGTQYRQTGVSLSFTPTVLADDQISLTVQPRIREIAAGGATIAGTIVPNINERSASTTVELGDGESIAIAGLYRRHATASESGIPLLKDIPLWGALFQTSRETERAVELIIVVTPRIVAAIPPETVARIEQPAASMRELGSQFYY
ncbi:MAG: pilus assembly protein N-terminal domain-containing protein [Gammaproteobacteria bacterium]|nr:pilus assembly protein N-terminal domain-containing protein [Gammaproteobacteria bacterium]